MLALWQEFRNAGFVSFFLLFFALAGIALSFVAFVLLVVRSRAAGPIAVAAVALGALVAFGGMAGHGWGRMQVDGAVSGGAVSKTLAERIRRVGYDEARSASRLGLVFSALPILVGAAVAFAAAARGKGGAPPGDPAAPPAAGAPGGFVLPAIALGVAGLGVAGAFAAIRAPLPGRDLAYDDPTWELIDLSEQAATLPAEAPPGAAQAESPFGAPAELTRVCERLEQALDGRPTPGGGRADAAQAPDLPAGAARCVDLRIARALAADPAERRARLDEIARSPLLLDAAQKRRVEEERARVPEAAAEQGPEGAQGAAGDGVARPAKPPSVRTGAASVSGRLPPEVIQRIVRQNMGRMRLCYENGLQKNPSLRGRVAVRFVIGRDGAVASAGDGGSDLPDAGVVSCVVRAFSSLSFPQPEGGIVAVTYPVVFEPG